MAQESAGVGQRRQVIGGDAIWNENSRDEKKLDLGVSRRFHRDCVVGAVLVMDYRKPESAYDVGDIYVPWARW
jgi:hypothetical protein